MTSRPPRDVQANRGGDGSSLSCGACGVAVVRVGGGSAVVGQVERACRFAVRVADDRMPSRSMSPGPGIRLPGRPTAARPRPAPRRAPRRRAPPAARNPASSASPAPTVLRGSIASAVADDRRRRRRAPRRRRRGWPAPPRRPRARSCCGRGDDVAEAGQRRADGLGELLAVGLDQVRPGVDARPAAPGRWCRRRPGRRLRRTAAVRLGVDVVRDARRQAAAQHDPGGSPPVAPRPAAEHAGPSDASSASVASSLGAARRRAR